MATNAATTKLLVIGDTHLGAGTLDRMPADVWDLAGAADLILHTGDVVEEAVLDALGRQAPVIAVRGNNDLGLVSLPETVERKIAGLSVAMIHDSGPTDGRSDRMAGRFPTADIVLFGHSHAPLVRREEDGPLLVNPGSPTQRRRQPVHTVAWLELGAGEVTSAEIHPVGPFAP